MEKFLVSYRWICRHREDDADEFIICNSLDECKEFIIDNWKIKEPEIIEHVKKLTVDSEFIYENMRYVLITDFNSIPTYKKS